jgi:hypothetical protein
VKDYDIVHHHLKARQNDGKCCASVKMFCSFASNSPFGWKMSNSYEFSFQTFRIPRLVIFHCGTALTIDIPVVWGAQLLIFSGQTFMRAVPGWSRINE